MQFLCFDDALKMAALRRVPGRLPEQLPADLRLHLLRTTRLPDPDLRVMGNQPMWSVEKLQTCPMEQLLPVRRLHRKESA